MNNKNNNGKDMIERYLYATTKLLPHGMRSDVDKELRTIIDDMLEARCGAVEPQLHDVRVVLAELGTPSELAARYDPNGEKALISAPYYRPYINVLKITLICVASGLLLGGILSLLVETSDKHIIARISEWLSGSISSLFGVFGLITLIFAVLERKGVQLDMNNDDLSKLPAVPAKNERIKRYECFIDIGFSILALIITCFAPQILCVMKVSSGGSVVSSYPLFDVELVKSLWLFWLGCAVCGVSRELFKVIDERYTVRVAVATLVADAVTFVLSAVVLLRNNIFSSEFCSEIESIFANEGKLVSPSSFSKMFLAFIAFFLLLDVVVTAIRAYKYRKTAAESTVH